MPSLHCGVEVPRYLWYNGTATTTKIMMAITAASL